MIKGKSNLCKMTHLKKVFLSICLIPIFGYAKIHTVDNNPGNGAMFKTIASAVNAATSGDTIIVMPSVSKYDGIYLSKKIFIYSRHPFSVGVDPDRFPYTDRINFYSGSAGSKVCGFHLNPGGIDIQENNVELSYNYLVATYVRIQGVSNVIIANNVFVETKYHGTSVQIDGSNNIIRNNYFATVSGGNFDGGRYSFILNGNSTNLIINNLFSESMSNGSNCTDGGFIFLRIAMLKFTTILCGAMSMAAHVLIP